MTRGMRKVERDGEAAGGEREREGQRKIGRRLGE